MREPVNAHPLVFWLSPLLLLAGQSCQSAAGPGPHLQSDRSHPAAASREPQASPADAPADERHRAFGRLLRTYVVEGKVRYESWLRSPGDRAALRDYVQWLAGTSPKSLDEPSRKAFWINAYNALTLNSGLERYPLTSVNFNELKDPGARGFWETPAVAGGQSLTLNQIEATILRPTFNDPRIHFAINCASNGCPVLAADAYCRDTLDQQLDARTVAFLNDPARGAHFDEKTGTLTVSMIFQWYAADFGDVTAFITRYRPELTGKVKAMAFLPYDWRLNDFSTAPNPAP
ncbi:DUF547 domain-containing protein [Chloracidobacterium aggregatum]|uniref:DUF547 domain-containing protein n=1 Tax=Chloracidobacterium sp. N TaxID=2821540 RepID=A0ABX8B651_9BACT|nr:DUF547 domain-containing protein [Chloracidobacterium aggregatum]QUV86656.1 DUF547 domain-containing protein [Chloracidobacterium sp. 2]QUV89726.1 DUF547 domain-containing protein [Chloracidobacterium sp. S]QUV92281.1 DUF547 domain-containing protein [Chloracidobacterium sp. A]QUV95557.1 DUF547 domain-containing protein [Chloracidobacterium sp. N]QUV98780.1 DUF547 domain-containing protein [Chloracidobacterium sp. E]